MNVDQFISDIRTLHANTRAELEDIIIQKPSAKDVFTLTTLTHSEAFCAGVLRGIESAAVLLLGREKMEEVLNIDPDSGLVAAR